MNDGENVKILFGCEFVAEGWIEGLVACNIVRSNSSHFFLMDTIFTKNRCPEAKRFNCTKILLIICGNSQGIFRE